MTDPNQPTPSAPEPQPPAPQTKPTQPAPEPQSESFTGRLPIGEEMDRGKWTMPPPKIIGIGLLVFAVIAVIIWAVAWRAEPVAAGAIDNVTVVSPVQDQVLVAIGVTFRNVLPEKTIWLQSVSARLTKADGQQLTDSAASFVDFERYFQAFPELKEKAIEPLRPDTRLLPGESVSGMIIVSFPVDRQTFDQRKELAVILDPYDQLPVTLTPKQ